MRVVLPSNVVRERVEKYLKWFIDESGVVKALKRLLDSFPNVNSVEFLYTENEGTIIYGLTTIEVRGKREVDKLLRWLFYEEEEESR